jgi:hypothetical protein
VVDAIHRLSSGFSEFSAIICNIQNILSRNPNFVGKFIKRQANMVAHTLARVASSWASRCICEILPLCISSLLNNEMIWVYVYQQKKCFIKIESINRLIVVWYVLSHN